MECRFTGLGLGLGVYFHDNVQEIALGRVELVLHLYVKRGKPFRGFGISALLLYRALLAGMLCMSVHT